MANENLGAAKKAKNDEFYTQYADIQKEMNAYLEYDPEVFKDKTILLPCDDPEWSNFTKYFAQNFETFGLKKLISTSYAPNSKPKEIPYQPTLFEMESPEFDEKKTQANGKIFTLTKDNTGDGDINFHDLEWSYLKGDGDFRSKELTDLRDEADIVITNPPFSLFREFLAWLIEGKKTFSIIGNMNAITYKEVFPLIMKDELWLGVSTGAKTYLKPDGTFQKMGNTCWFANLEHGRRHEPLELMTEADNIRFNNAIGEDGYQKYDNYDAIEVPRTDAIPSDYPGIMGVPISFLDKYNPDQFEILGITKTWDDPAGLKSRIYPQQIQVSSNGARSKVSKLNDGAALVQKTRPSSTHYEVEGKILVQVYARTLIRHRKQAQ